MKTPIREPKTSRRAGGKLDPITQLKSRPQEDIDWAGGLQLNRTREEAIAEIKNRLGIDLRWPTTYSRFLRWRQGQQRRGGLVGVLAQYRQFEKEADPAAGFETIKAAGAVLFLEKALRNLDAEAFADFVRLALLEKKLALQEKKLELARKRMELEEAGKQTPRPLPEPPKEQPKQDRTEETRQSTTPALAAGRPCDCGNSVERHEKHNEPARNSCGKTQPCAEKHNFAFAFFPAAKTASDPASSLPAK